ncbi:penicillin-binding protein-related factor A, recombinase [Psychrobacillus sp. AK 1817]|uniref:Holliday junction resolvase RecU n=1 Tax=Psychrobacillus sp. AK 1817 TaxID=2303505 RepID=UPI0012A31232|nr:Holliday junction resolvase RecU [Psychrobacillus sp. AK 1817]QEY21609.1 penicillin-binding protein-related factor A, recombinase [Psychrobacillus sp. AK 1817]
MREEGSLIVIAIENKKKGSCSKNPGKAFEKDFYDSIPENIFAYRMKDDSLGFANVKNACDFILYKTPNIYLLELKSHKGKSIPFGALQPYQVESLHRYSQMDGVVAGFVFNFRDMNETYFVDAVTVYQFYHDGERRSFSLEWTKENGIFIPQKLKRTRYQYDLCKLLNY